MEEHKYFFPGIDAVNFCRVNEPSRVLFVTIHQSRYPVPERVLHNVFSIYGIVKGIGYSQVSEVQFLIQLNSVFNARGAQFVLNGQCLYDHCCWLEVQFFHWKIDKETTSLVCNGVEEEVSSDIEARFGDSYCDDPRLELKNKQQLFLIEVMDDGIEVSIETGCDSGLSRCDFGLELLKLDATNMECVQKELDEANEARRLDIVPCHQDVIDKHVMEDCVLECDLSCAELLTQAKDTSKEIQWVDGTGSMALMDLNQFEASNFGGVQMVIQYNVFMSDTMDNKKPYVSNIYREPVFNSPENSLILVGRDLPMKAKHFSSLLECDPYWTSNVAAAISVQLRVTVTNMDGVRILSQRAIIRVW